jgi:hypothetical protein
MLPKAIKPMLSVMGFVGNWTIPVQNGHDYLKQVTAERREERTDTAGAFITSGNRSVATTTCSTAS